MLKPLNTHERRLAYRLAMETAAEGLVRAALAAGRGITGHPGDVTSFVMAWNVGARALELLRDRIRENPEAEALFAQAEAESAVETAREGKA